MVTPRPKPVFDPERALQLAGGRPAIRDQILAGVLAFLDDPATAGTLLDVTRYRSDAAACYEQAHRAVGLARQAAMPELESLFRALADALDAGDVSTAEPIGLRLPAAIAAVRAALLVADISRGAGD
jgi:hypothetical protein